MERGLGSNWPIAIIPGCIGVGQGCVGDLGSFVSERIGPSLLVNFARDHFGLVLLADSEEKSLLKVRNWEIIEVFIFIFCHAMILTRAD